MVHTYVPFTAFTVLAGRQTGIQLTKKLVSLISWHSFLEQMDEEQQREPVNQGSPGKKPVISVVGGGCHMVLLLLGNLYLWEIMSWCHCKLFSYVI